MHQVPRGLEGIGHTGLHGEGNAKALHDAAGKGDYAATRKFDSDEAAFVAKNKANIPNLGKEAEKALDGPEGDSLRDAEAAAAGRSRDNF